MVSTVAAVAAHVLLSRCARSVECGNKQRENAPPVVVALSIVFVVYRVCGIWARTWALTDSTNTLQVTKAADYRGLGLTASEHLRSMHGASPPNIQNIFLL